MSNTETRPEGGRELKELMAATRPFAEEDLSLSRFHLFTAAVLFLGLTAVASLDLFWPLRLTASILAGLVAIRFFIIYHDHHHGAVFRQGGWETWILNLFGLWILNPPGIWKRSHNYHHQHNAQIATASIGSFPVMTVAQYRAAPLSLRLKYRAARHPLMILFGYVTVFILGMCLKSFFKDPRKHWDSMLALVLHFALLTSLVLTGGWMLAVFALLIPLNIACISGAYLFYIQHNFPDMKLRPRQEWDYKFAALRSSSFMEASPVMHWFTGNIGYHHVHHLNHRIPFYNLPAAMAAIPELQNPGRTSLAPRDIARCFALKLWDPNAGRMIGFSGVDTRGPRLAATQAH